MLSSILAAVTQRPFFGAEAIKAFVRDSYDRRQKALYGVPSSNASVSLDKLRAMLIFISETERTWLIADQSDAYLVTDDRKWEDPRVEVPTPLKEMLPVEVNENWSESEGVLTFGDRTRLWRYSKDLFSSDSPKAAIERFLSPIAAGGDVSA